MNSAEIERAPAGELRILVGGFLEECIGQVIAKVVEKHLGYSSVTVRTIESLPAFLENAAQSPPDLFLLYLFFGDPADEAVTDPATSRAEISARLSSNSLEEPAWVTQCGLPLVTYLRTEFGKPVIVLTGCGHEPGRATRVEQAGGSALLLLPFSAAECAAAIGSCLENQKGTAP